MTKWLIYLTLFICIIRCTNTNTNIKVTDIGNLAESKNDTNLWFDCGFADSFENFKKRVDSQNIKHLKYILTLDELNKKVDNLPSEFQILKINKDDYKNALNRLNDTVTIISLSMNYHLLLETDSNEMVAFNHWIRLNKDSLLILELGILNSDYKKIKELFN